MVQILLEFGADINKQNGLGNTALYLAADNDNLALVEFLVNYNVKEKGAKIDLGVTKGDNDCVTPIMIATIKGHTEIVRFLMQEDANLTKRDEKDHTILHLAAMNNRHEVLALLAAKNEELVAELANRPNHEENTALHLATQAGHLETVRELLKVVNQDDVDNKNWDEQTPSHLAAAKGHSEVLGLLLQNDPNSIFDKDEEDDTPLHLAAKNKQSSTVKTLLAAGKLIVNAQQS